MLYMEGRFEMKITNLAIIFVLIILSFVSYIDARVNHIVFIAEKKVEYNKAVDSAIDDAVTFLVEIDRNKEIILNRNEAVNKFFSSLYANFGIISNPTKQKMMNYYIPIIAVTDVDGFFILYTDTVYRNGTREIVKRWTEKIPYSYEDGGLVLQFSTGDYVKVYDRYNDKVVEGIYTDLAQTYTNSIMNDNHANNKEIKFHDRRVLTIIKKIEEHMIYYINIHNKIAQSFGITYNFNLPAIDNDDWGRSIDGIGFIALFQGYPYGTRLTDIYSRFAFGASRLKKGNAYYIQKYYDGKLYYHRNNCNRLTVMELPYFSKKECALEGAYACEICIP